MRGKITIVINGRHYDAATGLAIEEEAIHKPKHASGNDIAGFAKPAAQFATPHSKTAPAEIEKPGKSRAHPPAAAVHDSLQRSQTLRRSAVKRPAVAHPVEHRRGRTVVPKSPHITKFAAHPQSIKKKGDVAPDPNAIQVRHHEVSHLSMPTKQVSSRAIKEHLINEQLQKAEPVRHEDIDFAPQKSRSRAASMATAGLALVLLGGYLTYLNMPSLSIRVAAAQAGIDASLPEYHPDGYRFNGPVSYSHGEVDMTYTANAGPQSYTISQKASDWDSQAVLDNYVLKESNGEYNIHSTGGLTVYTFGNKATWINNGILHVVDYGNAPLSYSQIERIAASM